MYRISEFGGGGGGAGAKKISKFEISRDWHLCFCYITRT